MAMPTLLDIAKANGTDGVVGLIEEASKANFELIHVPARTIKGINYPQLVRTGVPVVGFRAANEGTAAVKGTYERRLVECFILNPRWECDKAVADSYEDGAEAYLALEAGAIMEGAMQQLCKVFYYGQNATFGDAKGFPGLLGTYDPTNMVVDAGGTTDSTASSVWMVRVGPRDALWVWGNDGELAMADPRLESVVDSGGTNRFTAYIQELLSRAGLQVGSVYSVGRIKKLTADSGKGLTDALLFELFRKFPTGKAPNVIFMSRRSREQLRKSRTATNATGAPAPTPTEWEGIPIWPSDSISDVETLAL